ncbi:hypothetical protein K2173_014852 [Erythroxylum novogranatense]|uniref:FLZ-type domain-containing protein n=1 Tax=Erythroxylum novogranatense TaxID=1862640 RepID=A0AAV8TFV4_9ROSI|nr:hypothetical protein K2173_014852 [Erythroxylum novogranatense]
MSGISFGNNEVVLYDEYDDQRSLASMVLSPRYYHRTSGGFEETAHFLRTCGLCQRRLAPGKDIYMYRGDTAFCSLECREQQIKQDERIERRNNNIMATRNEDQGHASTGSKASAKTDQSSVAAA